MVNMEKSKERVLKIGRKSIIEMVQDGLPFILIIVLSLIVTILQPRFLTWGNISNVMLQYAGTGFVALGAMMVLISGGIDFTTAEIMACGSTLGGIWYLNSNGSAAMLILGCILAGLAVGLVNGILVAYVKFQPFIATLAMQALVHGVMLTMSEGKLILLENNATVDFLGKGRIFGFFPAAFALLLVFAIIMWFVMTRTKLGAYTYAIGGNEEALRASGVNVQIYKLLIYVMAGLCASLGTVMITCKMASVNSSVSSTLLLDAIAATVIGGTSTRGGKGNVIGTIVGTLIIGIIANATTLLHVPSNMYNVVKGVTIIFALLIDVGVNIKNSDA